MRRRAIAASSWLMTSGAFILLFGLGLDGLLHARNPQLAATEGLFTLANPGHVFLFAGIAISTVGALLFLVGQAAGGWGRAALLAAPIALLVALAGSAGLIAARGESTLSGSHRHEHAGVLAGGHAHGADALVAATEAERLAAADLVARTRSGSARFADFHVAQQEGYRQVTRYPFGDGTYGPAHFVAERYVSDGQLLDPEHPESLMYARLPDGRMAFLGVMFLAPKGKGPTPGGPITSWHSHDNLCIGADGVVPKRAGRCPAGTAAVTNEMMHLWLFDHPDGPFGHELNAPALAVAARQIRDGQVPLSSGTASETQLAAPRRGALGERIRALLGR
ncbi:MAG: hypothetical protein KatS3mg060_1094 [Dehalococcoidia bacterium]|nr:MAG: hypothetical protein KatS3mg060_1094 [Dehalococcoidia bacterium]